MTAHNVRFFQKLIKLEYLQSKGKQTKSYLSLKIKKKTLLSSFPSFFADVSMRRNLWLHHKGQMVDASRLQSVALLREIC